MKDDVIICRCEEITYGEVIEAIRNGATTLDGVKRMTRAGKGLCQGRTCRTLITQILREETGEMMAGDNMSSSRPPVRILSMEQLLGDEE